MSVTAQEPLASIPRSTVIAVVVATTVAQVASVMGIAVFPVIAPKLAGDMGIAPATIGYQISLVYGTASLGASLLSFTVVQWGACRTTQIGLLCAALAMALALTASLPGLVIASVLLGLSMALMTPSSTHLLFRFSPPKNRNLIFSIKQTGVPMGWMIMALIAPGITLAVGWRWSLVVVLVACVVTLAAVQPVREHWDDDRRAAPAVRTNPLAGLSELWRYPALRWLGVAAMSLSFVQLCLGTFLVTMLVEEAAYSLVAAGVLLSLVQAAGVGGRILWGWIADRTGDSLGLLQKLSVVSMVCCLAVAFIGPGWPTAVLVVFFGVFGAAAVGWNGLFLAEIARHSPRGKVSVATGAAMTWAFGGILIGPAMFASTFRLTGSYTVTYGLLTIVAAAAVIALALSRAAQRRTPVAQ